jgi:hypothetical protein
MASGIILVAAFVIVLVAALSYAYTRGFIKGMQHEALGWFEAFDAVQPPNWQSLPVSHEGNPEDQIEANKVYVQVFKVAKQVIGEELMVNRVEALGKFIPKK